MNGISNRSAGLINNTSKFNSKEEQRNEFTDGSGLETYDFGSRIYDAQIGKWNKPDPLCEKYLNFSPYTFSVNNPIRFYDPNGMEVLDMNDRIRFTGQDAISAFLLGSGRTQNVFVDVRNSEERRNEINAPDKLASYGQWAVFSVPSLSTAALALKKFSNISNLVVSNHGLQSHDDSYFEVYDKRHVSSDLDAISTSEIRRYNEKMGKELTAGESQVEYIKDLASKVASNGNLILAFCYTGKGSGGAQALNELNTLTENRINIFLPRGFAQGAVWITNTGYALALFHQSLSQAPMDGWITMAKNGAIKTLYDIKLDAHDKPVTFIAYPKK